ncbi:MAG: UbiD family decarboxylase, partial [Chloroflexota bacterium]
DEFPVPISTPGYDPAPYFTASCWVTKDPDTGIRNVGVYRAQVKSPTRTGVHFGDVSRHGYMHWLKYKERGKPLPVAIVVGYPPSVGYTGISRLPYGVDEFSVAGGIAGEPLELVKCKTVDLEVPAHAEIVVEGELTTEELELEAPFGVAVGFVGMTEMMPYLTVKCITHRRNPTWLSFLSQFPPSESSKIRHHSNEALVYKHLKHDLNLAHITSVAFHEAAGSNAFAVLQFQEASQGEVWKALEAAGQRFPPLKVVVGVDKDINPRDADAVNWAVALRAQPHRDSRIVKHLTPNLLDPSIENTEDLIKRRHAARPEKPEVSRLLINATLKWPYPPVSLPKKPFMEEALKLWQKEGLPPLKLKEPWWGYDLGYWGEEYDQWAEMAVRGEYYKTGEIRAKNNRVKI